MAHDRWTFKPAAKWIKTFLPPVLTLFVVGSPAAQPQEPPPAGPAVHVDQFQLDGSQQNQAIHSARPVGQTFTVGQSGLLHSLELPLFDQGAGGDLTVEILDMREGNLATAPTLGWAAVLEGTIGQAPAILDRGAVAATLVDLSSQQLKVQAGDRMAFRLTTTRSLPNLYGIGTAVFSDVYPGGAYFVGDGFLDGDAAFKTFIAVPVDQFQLNGSEQNQAIHSTRPVGQTFTVGQSGLLHSLELSLFAEGVGGDLRVEILDMSGGNLATAPTLASAAVPESAIGPFPALLDRRAVAATRIDLSSRQLNVQAGDRLAFRLSTTRALPNLYAIATAVLSDLYPRGAYFVGESFLSGDAAFKTFILPHRQPVCDVQLNKTSFGNGETVIAQVARLANPGPDPVPVEVKAWFEVPGRLPAPFLTVGGDGSLLLPSGFDQNFGPLGLLTVQGALPRGSYSFNCRLLHAVSGARLSEDSNPFQIH